MGKEKQNAKAGTKVTFTSSLLFKMCAIGVAGMLVVGAALLAISIPTFQTEMTTITKNYMLSEAQILGEEFDNSFARGLTIDSKDTLTQLLKDVKVNKIDSSYAYLVSEDATMQWHPTADKIGKPVENEVVKGITSKLSNGSFNFNEKLNVVEYLYKGSIKYASYYVGDLPDGTHYILVVTVDKAEVFGNVTAAITAMVIAMIVATIIAAAIILFFCQSQIAKPIQDLSGALDQISNLDLTAKASGNLTSRNDEIGLIAKSTVNLTARLKETLEVIREQSNKLSQSNADFNTKFAAITQSVNDVNTAVEEIAQGSTSQATETTSAGDQVGQMGGVIEQNSINAQTMDSAVSAMTDISSGLRQTLSELTDITKRTAGSIGEVAEQTTKTNESANKIQEATAAITSIASQTNLLSLNASIEAARAGEAGKGFAVVADEIRQLAENSAESAKLIEQVVAELIANSETSVNKMQSVGEDVQIQSEKLANTIEGFKKLDAEVSAVSTASGSVSEQTESLDSQKGVLTSAIEQLAAISEENAASTQETSASMHMLTDTIKECQMEVDTLTDLSIKLDEEIAKFKY